MRPFRSRSIGRGLPREQHRGAGVDVHGVVPERGVGVGKGRAVKVRGGVDQQVETAEARDRVAHEAGAGRGFGEVRAVRRRAPAESAERRRRLAGRARRRVVMHGDVGARPAEGQRDGAPDANSGAGHERNSPFEEPGGHGAEPDPGARRGAREAGRVRHETAVLEEGLPFGEKRPEMGSDGDERGPEMDRRRQRAACAPPLRGRRPRSPRGCAKVAGGEVFRLNPRSAARTLRRSASGKAADFVLDEAAGADEEEDHHRLRKEGEKDGRDRIGDVPRHEQPGLRMGRREVGGQGEALHGGQQETGESEERPRQKRDRHARQSL